MTTVSMKINGQNKSYEIEDRTLLVHFLRDHVGLTGTHVGCDTTQCGACTVDLDGRAVKSCTILAVAAEGCEVTTIEGVARGGVLSDLQEAFRTHHGLQCGFCTPGMIMAGADLIRRHGGEIDEGIVREELEGNICRCTGYTNIVKAVLDAAETYRSNRA